MFAVVDTNVLISGIFWSGPPSKILLAWENDQFELAITSEIFEEYKRVADILAKKYPAVHLNPIFDLILQHASVFTPVALPIQISSDPDDDKFIACALAANAKFIISGDDDLLSLKTYMGIEMVKPKWFIDHIINK
jgi:putative PIN family toxin of toxin-antitoxin system